MNYNKNVQRFTPFLIYYIENSLDYNWVYTKYEYIRT